MSSNAYPFLCQSWLILVYKSINKILKDVNQNSASLISQSEWSSQVWFDGCHLTYLFLLTTTTCAFYEWKMANRHDRVGFQLPNGKIIILVPGHSANTSKSASICEKVSILTILSNSTVEINNTQPCLSCQTPASLQKVI